MRLTKQARQAWFIWPLTVMLMSACGVGAGGNRSLPGDTQSLLGAKTPGTAIVQIDATAGGFGAGPDDPANRYTYFSFDTGQVLALSDEEASVNGAWQIAFKRTRIKLNGGVSGPGAVRGAVADGQDEFYDPISGDPEVSVFSTATPATELAAFDALARVDGLAYVKDRYIPAIRGDGSSTGWWLYSGPPDHTISANPDQWWLIRSAGGDSYAKFHVTDIVQDSRTITLEFFIQRRGENTFANVPVDWAAAIGSSGGSRCFDIDTAVEVACTGSAAEWDIKVEVAGRNWHIWTNGGVSGSGKGGAFGPFDAASIVRYTSGTASPSGTSIARMYRQDSAGGLFDDNTWYAYGLAGNNKLWPNYRVYAIDTGTGFYKLQILSYYDQAGVGGNYTIRYAPLAGNSRFDTLNVALSEWAISPDKTVLEPGPVAFNIRNAGPDDVHELLILKTDLGPDELPVDDNGNVIENAPGVTLVGKTRPIAVGEVRRVVFDLEPGNYLLICNIWDDGEKEAHYGMGMRASFLVQ